jgi:hypothetical protein
MIIREKVKWLKRVVVWCALTLVVAVSIRLYRDTYPHFGRLPHPDVTLTNKYKVKPYILAAIELQSIGQQRAEQRMLAYAKSDTLGSDQIYVLCRMLYSKSPGKRFLPPPLGRQSSFEGTTYLDWPLCPIEIVDGVPFLIAYGYTFYGMPGVPGDYLNYCMTNCQWSAYVYSIKSSDEVNSALNKLLNSPKWKQPLTLDEKAWLTDQIR